MQKSSKWVKHVITGVVDELNKAKNSIRGLALATAYKGKIVELKHNNPLKDILPQNIFEG